MGTDGQLPKIEKLFRGFKLQLENEGEYFSNLSDHHGEKGRLNETHLKNVLRHHLPDKYGIGTGFIVSNKSMRNDKNPQLDIIIYDKLNNAPLYQSEAFGIYPIEMVYAYIEVTTTLSRSKLARSFEINQRIRELQNHKRYIENTYANNLAPRFYIFAYKSKPAKGRLPQIVHEEYEKNGLAHSHGIYSLDKDILLARAALNDPKKVKVIVECSSDLSFLMFITNIRIHCESMISEIKMHDGKNLPRPMCLPPTHVQKYLEEI